MPRDASTAGPTADGDRLREADAERETRRMRGGNVGRPDAFSIEAEARPKRSPDSDIWEV